MRIMMGYPCWLSQGWICWDLGRNSSRIDKKGIWMQEKAVVDEKAEEEQWRKKQSYLVKRGSCNWDFWDTIFTTSNSHISLWSKDATADVEEIENCQTWVWSIVLKWNWKANTKKKNNNTEELVSFVDWRRISGMPGEKRIVVKRVTIEFQKRQYFKQYCLHFL